VAEIKLTWLMTEASVALTAPTLEVTDARVALTAPTLLVTDANVAEMAAMLLWAETKPTEVVDRAAEMVWTRAETAETELLRTLTASERVSMAAVGMSMAIQLL
jgi:hypothetical protein